MMVEVLIVEVLMLVMFECIDIIQLHGYSWEEILTELLQVIRMVILFQWIMKEIVWL